MSHEPGRESHMTHRCEKCQSAFGELSYNEDHDEYWCESCFDNETEAAYDRQQERVDRPKRRSTTHMKGD